MPYAELHVKTNFSFLEGASHPEELVRRAGELGYHALAITDRNSLAGVVRAHVAAKEVGLLRPALPMNVGRPTGARTHGHLRPNRRTLAAPESIN